MTGASLICVPTLPNSVLIGRERFNFGKIKKTVWEDVSAMKVLRVVGLVFAGLIVVAALAYQFRTDPIGPLAGKRLSGEEKPFPKDWAFSDAHPYCYFETRSNAPHSVTTICFVVNGKLIVPSLNAPEKNWPHYVLDDPTVRIKVGAFVYPARAARITGFSQEDVRASILRKYPSFEERVPVTLPDTTWLFELAQR